MMTHQGSRALNQTMSTHAPYSTKATSQVGPSTWKNVFLTKCMRALGLKSNGLRRARERLRVAKCRMQRRRKTMLPPIPAGGLKTHTQRIIRIRIRAYESLQQ